MREIGIVCPYAWDVPGGVQTHVRELAECLIGRGLTVSVLAPFVDPRREREPYVESGGRAVAVPFNGSIARIAFGPSAWRSTARWLRRHDFDVIHLHEPTVPSCSLLVAWFGRAPMVATAHTARRRNRSLSFFAPLLQLGLERLVGRTAVSAEARRMLMTHIGADAVLLPNGITVSRYEQARREHAKTPTPTILFLGRVDEDRKGLSVLLAAMPRVLVDVPDATVLVAGPGTPPELAGVVPASALRLLGTVPESEKAALMARAHVYCAPNTHGESFGIVLLEAMASGTAVVASDLEAFQLVLDRGRCGRLVPVGDPGALATALVELLRDPSHRRALEAQGRLRARSFDWARIADDVLAVYEAAVAAAPAGTSSARPR